MVTIQPLSGDAFPIELGPGDLVAVLRRKVAEHVNIAPSQVHLAEGSRMLGRQEVAPLGVTLSLVQAPRQRLALGCDCTSPVKKKGRKQRLGALIVSDLVGGTVLDEDTPPLEVLTKEDPRSIVPLSNQRIAIGARVEGADNACVVADLVTGSIVQKLAPNMPGTSNLDICFGMASCGTADAVAMHSSKHLYVHSLGEHAGSRLLNSLDASSFCSLADIGNGRLAAGDSGREVGEWDIESGRRIATIENAHECAGWVETISRVGVSGHLIVTGSDTCNKARVWDMRDASCVQSFDGHGNNHEAQGISEVHGIVGTERFAAGDCLGVLRVWELGRTDPVFSVQAHGGEMRVCAGSDTIYTSGRENYATPAVVRTWNAQTGEPGEPMSLAHAGRYISEISAIALI